MPNPLTPVGAIVAEARRVEPTRRDRVMAEAGRTRRELADPPATPPVVTDDAAHYGCLEERQPYED